MPPEHDPVPVILTTPSFAVRVTGYPFSEQEPPMVTAFWFVRLTEAIGARLTVGATVSLVIGLVTVVVLPTTSERVRERLIFPSIAPAVLRVRDQLPLIQRAAEVTLSRVIFTVLPFSEHNPERV
jgi:hypothetical protein